MPISDAELQILIEKIALDHNWDLNAYKWPTLKRRIKARMVEKKCETPEKYYALIDSDPEEYKNLINALTVNYTQWFRDDSDLSCACFVIISKIKFQTESHRNH